MKTTLLTFVVLGALLIAALAVGIYVWQSIGATEISIWGWIAMIAGSLVTLGVGGGLMALVFHSARRGYDDDVQ
tara:strand:+ start:1062 stop:1283 length:222 start_codon:yes stop_codon:yes gene_type:complete